MNNSIFMYYPAASWREAIPVGNGCLGAMVYGSVSIERILINHERLWYRGCVDALPDVAYALPRQRDLMRDGKYREANDIFTEAFAEHNYMGRCASYHPAGDIIIDMPPKHPFQNYVRRLDMNKGLAVVEWRDGDIRFSREIFVSRADDICVIKIKADKPSAINATISLMHHDFNDAIDEHGNPFVPPIKFCTHASGNLLHMVGRYTEENLRPTENGREYCLAARLITKGGEISPKQNSLNVKNADELIIMLKASVYCESETELSKMDLELDAIEYSYEELLSRHEKLHSELFSRTTFELDTSSDEHSNEELLMDAYRSGQTSCELAEKMAAYGRYLLIASSCSDGVPSNLQGIWNGDYDPAWSCFLMVNENLQMNYWQSLPGRIPEMLLSVINFYSSYISDFRENAKKIYNCGGIFVPALMCPETGLSTHCGPWIVNWISGAGWLARHFYDYYLFTGDEKVLLEQIVPFMVEVAQFYEDFLVENRDGIFEICPSVSPENWPVEFNDPQFKTTVSETPRVTINATIDVAVARELLNNLLNICRRYRLYQERQVIWQNIVDKLPQYEINPDGAICEWLDKRFSDNYHHRHLSHIFPAFPGVEIRQENAPSYLMPLTLRSTSD